MSGLRKEGKKVEKDLVEIYQVLELQHPPLLVSWQSQDIGRISSKGIDFLIEKLGGVEVARIKPFYFFSFGGVRFKGNVAQVQESKFWALEKNNLLIFKSDEPESDHYRFLNTLLDVAEHYFKIRELYTINGMASLISHIHPRKIWAVFNQREWRERFKGYGLEALSWKGFPALSSYLLWVAKKRFIPGVSLWPEVPFYLGPKEDAQAIQSLLSFLDRRFDLSLDLKELDVKIREQNERIACLRRENAEVDGYLSRLEKGQELDKEEQMKLVKEVYGIFPD